MVSRSARAWALAVTVLPAGASLAADWPQWRGPDRDGVSKEEGLLQQWPSSGPPQLWLRQEVGAGYSAPAAVGVWAFDVRR